MIQLTLTEDEKSMYEKKLLVSQELINRLTEEKKSLLLRVDKLENQIARGIMK